MSALKLVGVDDVSINQAEPTGVVTITFTVSLNEAGKKFLSFFGELTR